MTKLDELIQELCPDGVEYKELQEILTIKNGSDYKHLSKGDIPVSRLWIRRNYDICRNIFV